jgi:hypothetical protein
MKTTRIIIASISCTNDLSESLYFKNPKNTRPKQMFEERQQIKVQSKGRNV